MELLVVTYPIDDKPPCSIANLPQYAAACIPCNPILTFGGRREALPSIYQVAGDLHLRDTENRSLKRQLRK